jgi:four helix bundle protein
MTDKRIKENVILQKTFDFALDIMMFAKELEEKRNFVVSNQLLKSGTSIGANCWEAQNCESKADFIHKIKIAAKEADETMYWLLLCKHAKLVQEKTLLTKLETVQKILNKIIQTSKQKK